MTEARPRIRVRRVVFVVIVVALLGELLVLANTARAYIRTTPVYDPPVLAGQMVTCTAGFYARRGETIVLTISDHCYDRANPPRDATGRLIGATGRTRGASPARRAAPARARTWSSSC